MDDFLNILKAKLQNLSENLKASGGERILRPNILKTKKTQKGRKE